VHNATARATTVTNAVPRTTYGWLYPPPVGPNRIKPATIRCVCAHANPAVTIRFLKGNRFSAHTTLFPTASLGYTTILYTPTGAAHLECPTTPHRHYRIMEITYVIGDIGAHEGELRRELIRIGAAPTTFRLPAGVHVVQVGDLIDRGPHSLETINLAKTAHEVNEGRYVQLLGNHETNWLEPTKVFSFRSDPAAVDALYEWVERADLYLAAAIASATPTLATHAGLTRGLWSALGSPADPREAAASINNAWGTPLHPLVARPGYMLGLGVDEAAGVYWAEAGFELYASWSASVMPFDQVHGHSSSYDWEKSQWRPPSKNLPFLQLDTLRRHVTYSSSDKKIVGIDPCFTTKAGVLWSSYKVEGAPSTPGARVTNLHR
jgi:hypothetical protein